jgi:DNA-binding MarR family transcriptional regulator
VDNRPEPTASNGDVVRLYQALARITRSLRRGNPDAAIGHGAFSALATLVTDGEQRAGRLAEIEGISPPAMTRLLNYLEENGYVSRRPDPNDRRASVVVATDAGRALVLSGRAERLRALQARCEGLSAQDRARLLDALPALEALGDDMPAED